MRFYTALINASLVAFSAKAKISPDEANFLAYLAEHGKSYTSRAEFDTRLQNWKLTDEYIKNYPATTFTLSHNPFSDYSDSEKEQILGRKKIQSPSQPSTQPPPLKDGSQSVSSKQRLGARCADGFTLDPETKTCVASTSQGVSGNQANTVLKSCGLGNYNDGTGKCSPCGAKCYQCRDITGACSLCDNNHPFVDVSATPQRCLLNCKTLVGNVENPPACASSNFSDTRVVPPYALSTKGIQWVDWRDKYVMRPVKDQIYCDSYWAFAATAATESAYAIKTGALYNLSPQYLLDCDTSNQGCNGGKSYKALSFMAENGAISDADYPYVSGKTMVAGTCDTTNKEKLDLLVSPGYAPVQASYGGLKAQLLQQPVKVSFEALYEFFFYKNGVYQTSNCTNTKEALNHEMTAIGFGVLNGVEYILVQNQWYPGFWGMKGYAYILFDAGSETGTCGIYLDNLVATV